MTQSNYVLSIEADSIRLADTQTRTLVDDLREISGVEKAERTKPSDDSMDLGTIITVLASSGATLAISNGIADWLRSRRSTKLTIERDAATDSIKATVEQIDPATAQRIIEVIKGQ